VRLQDERSSFKCEAASYREARSIGKDGRILSRQTPGTVEKRRSEMGRVVALMDDLFFQMKLAETAKQLGVEVKVAANGEALMELMASEPKLVIVDLNARSQPIAAIESLRRARKDIRVVGFLSHVQRDLAAQAQAAGCDEVLPRSSFTQNLAAILSAAKD
jgi:DNA-binding NarL/FixJ family response regulator